MRPQHAVERDNVQPHSLASDLLLLRVWWFHNSGFGVEGFRCQRFWDLGFGAYGFRFQILRNFGLRDFIFEFWGLGLATGEECSPASKN